MYAVVGAALEVYKELGVGFLKAVYQEALEWELRDRGIPFEAQKQVVIYYKARPLKHDFSPDLVCHGQLICELKALNKLTTLEESQLLNSLKATRNPVGLLIHFGSPGKLEWKRFVK